MFLNSSPVEKTAKRCSRCGVDKPLEQFAVDRSKRSGRKTWCRACDAERSIRYYQAHVEERRRKNRERARAKAALGDAREPKKCRKCGRPAISRRHWYCQACWDLVAVLRNESAKARQRRRVRASTAARGYGRAHQLLRSEWKKKVDAGGVNCARCGDRIEPGSPWDLGHDDEDRTRYWGPEHRRCNRQTGTHRVQRERGSEEKRPLSRVW